MNLNFRQTEVLLIGSVVDRNIAGIYRHLQQHCQNWQISLQPPELRLVIQAPALKLILLNLAQFQEGSWLLQIVKNCRSKPTLIGLLDEIELPRKPELIAAGFDECLLKPVASTKLDELLEVWNISRRVTDAGYYVSALLTKTHGNRNLALVIFNKLFIELPQQLQIIQEALQNRSYETARFVTHSMKGAVSLCGFLDIQKAAQSLEVELGIADPAEITGAFQNLQRVITQLLEKQPAILVSLA